MARLWIPLLLSLLAIAACGDDEQSNDRGGAPPVAGGSSQDMGECPAGLTEYPSDACDCPMGRRVCGDDGTWGECICPEIDECLDAIGWVCPNACPGDDPDAGMRILQCVDGKPPTCECPDE